jgi:hypothetical protein
MLGKWHLCCVPHHSSQCKNLKCDKECSRPLPVRTHEWPMNDRMTHETDEKKTVDWCSRQPHSCFRGSMSINVQYEPPRTPGRRLRHRGPHAAKCGVSYQLNWVLMTSSPYFTNLKRLKNHFGYLLVRFPDNHPSIIFYPSNLSLSDGFLSQFHGTYVT